MCSCTLFRVYLSVSKVFKCIAAQVLPCIFRNKLNKTHFVDNVACVMDFLSTGDTNALLGLADKFGQVNASCHVEKTSNLKKSNEVIASTDGQTHWANTRTLIQSLTRCKLCL